MVTAKMWRRWSLIYRTLVAVQTIGLAAIALSKVISRAPRPWSAGDPLDVALAVGAALGLAGGLLTHYRRQAFSSDRDAIVAAWACFQGAGLLALAGYVISGTVTHFVAAMLMLIVMHAFSPNRFRGSTEPES